MRVAVARAFAGLAAGAAGRARQSPRRGAPARGRRRAMATAAAPPGYAALASELREIDSLAGIDAILSWDELVVMKEKSAASRAAQKATLASILHERQTSQRLGELISGAEREMGKLEPMRSASVRDARRTYDRKVKMPAALAREEARLGSEGYQAWAKAREADDYEAFKPVLAKIVRLRLEESAAVAPDALPYDYQIDKFERGMKRERLAEVFDELKAGLVPLIKAVTSAPQLEINEKISSSTFDVDKQEALCEKVMDRLGFDGILSRSVHPYVPPRTRAEGAPWRRALTTTRPPPAHRPTASPGAPPRTCASRRGTTRTISCRGWPASCTRRATRSTSRTGRPASSRACPPPRRCRWASTSR